MTGYNIVGIVCGVSLEDSMITWRGVGIGGRVGVGVRCRDR